MARNAHPEVTRARILDAATKLFAERGYEHTSVQNIIDELGDLSKGAIYHHFPSKLAILEALNQRDNDDMTALMERIQRDDTLDGLGKLRAIAHANLSDMRHMQFSALALSALDDATTFAENMRFWSRELPKKWLPIIQEGVEDGSIPTAYPVEAAQMLALLMNYWMLTRYYPATADEFRHRAEALRVMLDALGLPLFDDELFALFVDSYLALNGLEG